MDRFRDWMITSGAPRRSVAVRLSYVARCEQWLGRPLLEADADDLIAWIAAQRRWSRGTRKSARGALHLYYSWLISKRLRQDNPADGIPRVRVPRESPRRPPQESAIVEALRVADRRDGVHVMILCACWLGLRRVEIARIRRRDLDDGGILTVLGKGDKRRQLPLPSLLVELIRRGPYGRNAERNAARGVPDPEGYVWPGRFGRHVEVTFVGDRLSAVLPPGFTAHSLRHRMATIAHEVTQDLLGTQEVLGHADPSTTADYIHPTDAPMRRVIEAARPPGLEGLADVLGELPPAA